MVTRGAPNQSTARDLGEGQEKSGEISIFLDYMLGCYIFTPVPTVLSR